MKALEDEGELVVVPFDEVGVEQPQTPLADSREQPSDNSINGRSGTSVKSIKKEDGRLFQHATNVVQLFVSTGNHVFIGAATTRPAVDCIYDVTPVSLAKNVQAEPEGILASKFLDLDPRDLTDIKVQTPDEETAPLVSVEYDVDVQAELKPQGVLASIFLDPKDLATDIKVEAVGETAGLVTSIAENGVTPLEENPEELYDNTVNVKYVPTSVTRKNEQLLPGDGSSRKVIACTEEGGEKPHKCQLCNYRSTRKSSLKQHERAVHHLRPYKCQFCDYRATRKAELMRHTPIHTGERPYQCKLCNYTAIQKETLKRHEMRHRGEEPEKKPASRNKCHKCQYCDYRSARKGNISIHEMIHTGEQPYRCQSCDKGFSRKIDVERHLLVHSGEKPYKCHYCDYRAAQKGNVKVHERIHTGSTAVITPTPVEVTATAAIECTYSVATGRFAKEEPVDYENEEAELKPQDSLFEPSDLTKILDIKVEALDETELVVVPVDEIGAEQLQPSLEESHEESSDNSVTVDSVTSVALEEENSNPLPHEQRRFGEAIACAEEKPASRNKCHKCQYCDYRTARKGNISIHEMIHTGEQPYRCQSCDKGFSRKETLERHLLVQSGEKPYKCQYCDYRAAQKGNVKTHEGIHTGEKPYKCSFCDYSAVQGSSIIYVTQFEKNVKVCLTQKGNYPCLFGLCAHSPNQTSIISIGRFEAFRLSHFFLPTSLKMSRNLWMVCQCGRLKEHENSVHKGERPYQCTVCSYRSAYKSSVKCHEMIHSGEKPRSAHKSDVKKHEMLHRGEKPYKCQFCTYASARKQGVQKHELAVHKKEKPYECRYCDYRSTESGNLRSHERAVHLGIKPYKCRYCDYRATQSVSIRRHEHALHLENV